MINKIFVRRVIGFVDSVGASNRAVLVTESDFHDTKICIFRFGRGNLHRWFFKFLDVTWPGWNFHTVAPGGKLQSRRSSFHDSTSPVSGYSRRDKSVRVPYRDTNRPRDRDFLNCFHCWRSIEPVSESSLGFIHSFATLVYFLFHVAIIIVIVVNINRRSF